MVLKLLQDKNPDNRTYRIVGISPFGTGTIISYKITPEGEKTTREIPFEKNPHPKFRRMYKKTASPQI